MRTTARLVASAQRPPVSAPQDRLTEAGAAERFVRMHGDAVRFALRLERRDALSNMLALVRALRPVADAGAGWDRDAWLLGTANGVVDLRTGMLRPSRPSDGITMAASAPFDPEARCPRFDEFLTEVFDGDAELTRFVHRAAGYTLTGVTTEQCLFLGYGSGANGKTTLLQTLKHVLGDYAVNTPFSTVELHARAGIPNDLAALVNRRLVMASETNDGTRLNESRIKALTGGDSITARFLHGEFFTFDPVAKFWLSVNHKPVVRDDSHGFWRRLRLIPFTRTFALNPRLGDELRAEAAGILRWAVEGCLDWQRHGLNPPAVVVDATGEYERESDPLATFVDEACEREPHAQVRAADLYAHYQQWATKTGLTERERLTMQAFGRKLGERFRHERTRAGKVYFGIARGTL